MGNAQQRAKRQQRVEELCAATLRALSGDRELHYRGRHLRRGPHPLPIHAPHLHTDPADDAFPALRATVDGIFLRLRFSDARLHGLLAPRDSVERMIFELLEQLRVETFVPEVLPGMADNVRRRFVDWLQEFYDSGLTESSLGILLFTVALVCRTRLTGEPAPEHMQDAVEATRAAIAPLLGRPLAGLRRDRADQAAYAENALRLARTVGEMIRDAVADDDGRDEESDSAEQTLAAFSLLLDFDADDRETIAAAQSGDSKVMEQSEQGYRIYTTRYDQRLQAASEVRPELLREYRQRLDRLVAAQRINFRRIVNQLMAVLAIPRRDGWSFGEESGQIDGRRLAQLVSTPTEHRLFRRDRYQPGADCAISLLIDCSGSMKQHVEPLAVLVDVLVRALEQVQVSTEVLGFTTAAWNGGRAWQDWLAGGRPKTPGRLNETCQLIFKDADHTWRRARQGIAALFKTDLYREGVDGEAVEWACGRLAARAERRRVLVVISDGSPMDSATALTNDAYYLDNHLRDVVARREAEGQVEIVGLGVGLDLSPYYSHSLATDLSQGLDHILFSEIADLLGGGSRRR